MLLVDTEPFTERERDLLGLLMMGVVDSMALAARMKCRQSTIKYHMDNVMKKTRLSRRGELVSYAWQYGELVRGRWSPKP